MTVLLGHAYNGSFNSASFMLLLPIVAPPIAQNATQYHIAGTDSNFDIDLGKGMANWEQKVGVDAADLATLKAKVGTTGTYVGDGGNSYSDVKLKGITPPIKAAGFTTYEVTLQLAKGN